MKATRFPGLRAAALAALGVANALLLVRAPGLDQVKTVTLPIQDGPEVPMLAVTLMLTLGIATVVFLVPKLQFVLYGTVIGSVSWSFGASSRIPWWLLGSEGAFRVRSPRAATILLAVLTLMTLLSYMLVRNLELYSAAQDKRGVDPALTRADLGRIGFTYTALLAPLAVVGVLLVYLFEEGIANGGLVPTLSGSAWGAWVLVLVVALLGGILLLLDRSGGEPGEKADAATAAYLDKRP